MGFLLAQVGFFVQRRVAVRGEVSKAAYFLILVLDDIKLVVKIREGKFVKNRHFSEELSLEYGSEFILGGEDFHKEVAATCERISLINIGLARDVRNLCMLIALASKGGVNSLRKSSPDVADMTHDIYVKCLKSYQYKMESYLFHILINCDLGFFLKFFRKIGWKRGVDIFLGKNKSYVSVEDLKLSLETIEKCYLKNSNK